MKQNQSGRSMIEMLGVLAIVGVLTAGGVAGFSKALLTYRYNKALAEWDALVNAVTKYNSQLRINDGSVNMLSLLPIFQAAGDLPDKMVAKNLQDKDCENLKDDCYVVDSLGNKISVYSHSTRYVGIRSDNNGYETCRLFLNIVKANHKTIDYAEYYTSQPIDVFYGDSRCSKSNESKCVKNLTVSQISEICKSNKIVKGGGIFLIYWYSF